MAKPTAKFVIRRATPMDSVNIVRLLKQQHGESVAKLLAPFDEQTVLQYVTATLGNPKAFTIAIEQSGRLVGSAAMAPIVLPWCGVMVLGEAWFAVVPTYRTQGIADKLLDAVATVVDNVGVPAFHGTNLLAPEDFDAILAKRDDLLIGRTSFVRLPVRSKGEAAA